MSIAMVAPPSSRAHHVPFLPSYVCVCVCVQTSHPGPIKWLVMAQKTRNSGTGTSIRRSPLLFKSSLPL